MPNKITAPIARSTAYDFNCKLARCHQTDRHAAGDMFVQSKTDEDRHVMPHEILFQRNDGKHNTRMQAMSSLNGIADTTELREALREISALFSQIAFRATLSKEDSETMLRDWKTASGSQDNAERRTARLANLQLTQLFRYVGVAITG